VPGETETQAEGSRSEETPGRRRPGLLLIFSGTRPAWRVFPLQDGVLTIGRGDLPDERLSRAHAEVVHRDGRWLVRDLDSRNGTFVDGQRVQGEGPLTPGSVLRLASSLFLPRDHLAGWVQTGAAGGVDAGAAGGGDDFAAGAVQAGAVIAGPALQAALAAVRRAAASGRTLLITGETGAGKEVAARAFHAAGPTPDGPFVAVNCAAIPEGLAERLLFGARRGAYSGATADAPGYLQAAAGGVLFLDEIGELELAVQAKLLRVLESQEVLPLGAVRPIPLDARFCWATHRNLRAAVAEGRFRADLFYRISAPAVAVPPLRERPEEIPLLVARALGDSGLVPHSRLVESCLLRPWPGNVRELLGAVAAAAQCAAAESSQVVRRQHLDPAAGEPLTAAANIPGTPDRAAVEQALAVAGGNIAAAARALGLHRTQLYRLLARMGLRADDAK
jgi:transcriptional regulator with AAA-type ATPase domain